MPKLKLAAGSGPWLTVINYPKRDECCSGCGQAAILFSAYHTAQREVFSRCKPCLVALATNDKLEIIIKTTWPKLAEVWAKNKRVAATPTALKGLAAIQAKRARMPIVQDIQGIPVSALKEE